VLSKNWVMREGDTGLFELRQPMDYTSDLRRVRPEVARAMEERLDWWYRGLSGAAPARAA
jgi:hypothetical protein